MIAWLLAFPALVGVDRVAPRDVAGLGRWGCPRRRAARGATRESSPRTRQPLCSGTMSARGSSSTLALFSAQRLVPSTGGDHLWSQLSPGTAVAEGRDGNMGDIGP